MTSIKDIVERNINEEERDTSFYRLIKELESKCVLKEDVEDKIKEYEYRLETLEGASDKKCFQCLKVISSSKRYYPNGTVQIGFKNKLRSFHKKCYEQYRIDLSNRKEKTK
jgi:hypothetical protein